MLLIALKTLFAFLGIIFAYSDNYTSSILMFLISISISFFCMFMESKKITAVLTSLFFVAGLFFGNLVFFVPLMIMNLVYHKLYIIIALMVIQIFLRDNFYIIILLATASGISQYLYDKVVILTEEKKALRDSTKEEQIQLISQNKFLTDKVSTDIHLARLKERNRISRDIHDNVGHLLTRSLLQLAAINITKKDPLINELQDTINQAMTTIRDSVHNLHDQSLDLKTSVLSILEGLSIDTHLDYDMDLNLDTKIVYGFLAIIKEATTNITKYSNATGVNITLREHPSFFQLLIADNGTNINENELNKKGLGIYSMENRAEELGGYFNIRFEKGCKIFVSVPKKVSVSEEVIEVIEVIS